MRAEDVRTVGIIGCGLMGSGIAEVVARAGQNAVVLETSDELVERRGAPRIQQVVSAANDGLVLVG